MKASAFETNRSVSFHFFKWLAAGIGPRADRQLADRRARHAAVAQRCRYHSAALREHLDIRGRTANTKPVLHVVQRPEFFNALNQFD